jgi:hypothetical protein
LSRRRFAPAFALLRRDKSPRQGVEGHGLGGETAFTPHKPQLSTLNFCISLTQFLAGLTRHPRIPKGFRLKAQGRTCRDVAKRRREERATLGSSSGENHNPTGVAALVNIARPQPRRGCVHGRSVLLPGATACRAEASERRLTSRRLFVHPQPSTFNPQLFQALSPKIS